MVINNSQIEILKLFLSDPTNDYNIKEISGKIKINYKLVYQGIKDLEKKGIVFVRKIGQTKLCKINLTSSIFLFSYIENLRKEVFQKKHPEIRVIESEMEKIGSTYFTAIVFGSFVKGSESKKSDIDLLFIIPNQINLQDFEREAKSILKILSYNLDIGTITEGSFLEMKNKKGLNVVNEIIENHIILIGTEQYYRMLIK